MSILKLDRLNKRFDGSEKSYLFNNVTTQIERPEIVALLGESGQGKSTLLRILSLLDRPSEGEIYLFDKPSEQYNPREWRKKVCYVAQMPVMFQGSVEENLRIVSMLHQTKFDDGLAKKLMVRIGLDHIDWNKKADDLSGGERQRLALVRSMLLRPEVFLMDEITASLDIHSKKAVEQLLGEWSYQEGATMVWVTHDLEQARLNSHRIWFMADGALQDDCETENFFQNVRSESAKSFLKMPDGGNEQVCQLIL